MLAKSVGTILGWERVLQLDVGHQTAAGIIPLDQIVAQDLVVRKGVADSSVEGFTIVDSLAGKAADAKKVLIGVRDRGGIRIEARGAGIEPCEKGLVCGDEADTHARLKDAVTADDAPLFRVEARLVQRMSEGSDQAPRCLVGELRVRIERDNETDLGEAVQAAAEHRETRVAVTT